MNEKRSGFRKRYVRKPIEGTRTSPHTGQLITSSGNLSLDAILGGGLAVGSVCLIEEDKYGTHAKVMAKYFLAEGLYLHHSFFLGSLDDKPSEFLMKLPKVVQTENTKAANEQVKTDSIDDPRPSTSGNLPSGIDELKDFDEKMPKNGLRIAWRYNDLPFINSEQTVSEVEHTFDLSQPMGREVAYHLFRYGTWTHVPLEFRNVEQDNDKVNIPDNNFEDDEEMELSSPAITLTAPGQEGETQKETETEAPKKSSMFENERYDNMLRSLQSMLGEHRYTLTSIETRTILRICITSLGSPLWMENEETFGEQLLKCLTIIRASVRSATAVCMITLPMHLIAKLDPSLVPKIRNLVDYSIELESFAGSDRATNPAFKEHHGLFHVHRISAVNALSPFQPEITDLAFKLRRKNFVIEKLHLPPELEDDNNKEEATASASIMPGMGCSANLLKEEKQVSMDF